MVDTPKRWTDLLSSPVWNRLCNCRSLKSDLVPLTRAKWTVMKNKNPEYTKDDALADVLDHLDCNSQWFDITREEWDDIIAHIEICS